MAPQLIGGVTVLDRDEARFAQATAQMLETGDLITIKFQESERNKKPAGIHWLQALSVSTFSSVEAREIWAYRLPSMMGGFLAIILTYLIGIRLFNPQTAMIGALILAASPSLIGEANIAKTDAVLLATICAVQWALASILFSSGLKDRAKIPLKWPVLFWISLGASILIKGPIGPLIIFTTITGLLIFGKTHIRFQDKNLLLALRPFTGLIILLFIIAPWAIAINEATQGRFFSQALGKDMLGKIGSAQEHHAGPPGFHLLLLPVLMWPAVLFLPRVIWSIWKEKITTPILFLLTWIIPCWLIFEFTATKLPHYVLPLYPAIALLTGHVAVNFVNSAKNRLPFWLKRIGAIAFLTIGVGFAIVTLILPALYHSQGIKIFPSLLVFLVIIATLTVQFLTMRKPETEKSLITASCTAMVIMVILFSVSLPSIDKFTSSQRVSKKLIELGRHPIHSDYQFTVSSTGYYEPSLVFYLGTPTQLLPSVKDAVKRLKTSLNHTAIVEARFEDQFLIAAKTDGVTPLKLAQITGYNYSKGDEITLIVYAITHNISQ